VQQDDKTVVFLVDGEVAHLKEVKVGSREGDQVEILSGVGAGQKVATTGAFELDEGTKIRIAK
jgi:multidrug efflux pump subunit AcrA (membrane-fusion protein)